MSTTGRRCPWNSVLGFTPSREETHIKYIGATAINTIEERFPGFRGIIQRCDWFREVKRRFLEESDKRRKNNPGWLKSMCRTCIAGHNTVISTCQRKASVHGQQGRSKRVAGERPEGFYHVIGIYHVIRLYPGSKGKPSSGWNKMTISFALLEHFLWLQGRKWIGGDQSRCDN